MENFIWKKLSEEEKQEIKKQAEKILEKFSKALKKVKTEEYKHFENKSGFREETKTSETNKEFQDIFFQNAPKKNKNYIIGEKKSW